VLKRRIDQIEPYKIILLLILILAAALRLYNLDYQSPWLDEIHTLNESNPSQTLSEVYKHILQGEQLPPLYFFIVYFIFKIFGYSIFVARFFSAIIGVLTVYMFYLFGKELIDKKTGVIAALFMAVNYYALFYSQEARPYILLVFLTIASFYHLILFLKNNTIRNAVWYGIMSGLVLHAHVFGFLTILAQGVTLMLFLIYLKRTERNLFFRRCLISAFIAIVVYLPALHSFLRLFEIESFWIEYPSKDVLSNIYNSFFGDSEILWLFNLIFFIGFLNWLSQIKTTKQSSKISNTFIVTILLLWISLTILIPLIRTYVSVPMIIGRYFIGILPAVLMIFSIGLSKQKNSLIIYSFVSLYAIFSLVHILFVKDYYGKVNKSQFREVTLFISENNLDNDEVVSSLAAYLPYFFEKSEKDFNIVNATLDNYIAQIINKKRPLKSFWYFDGPGREFNPSEGTLDFLQKNYVTQESYSGIGAWTRYYEIKDASNTKIDFTDTEWKKLVSLEGVRSHIESFKNENKKLRVNGWIMLENVNSENTKITALLIKERQGYVIEATRVQRPDVTRNLNLDYNARHSGFNIDLELIHFPKDNYTFGLLIENKQDNKRRLLISEKQVNIE
jgi:uncharacterized membrane protein